MCDYAPYTLKSIRPTITPKTNLDRLDLAKNISDGSYIFTGTKSTSKTKKTEIYATCIQK